MIKEKLLLEAIIHENLLKVSKSQYYHELLIEEQKNKDEILKNCKGKELRVRLSIANKTISELELKRNRAEKYNNELTKAFMKVNSFDVERFIDSVHDHFSDTIDLIFKHTADCSVDNKKIFIPALLEESEKGNNFINGKKYIIHIK